MVDDINAVAKVSTTETSSSSTSKKAGKKKKNICFVISPFGGWNDRYYSEIYMPAVRDAGLELDEQMTYIALARLFTISGTM
jgi:hypothetical protein